MRSFIGSKAIYLPRAAFAASRALPDLGLIYSNEIADRTRELVRASGLPLLVDIDTGFGGILNGDSVWEYELHLGVYVSRVKIGATWLSSFGEESD